MFNRQVGRERLFQISKDKECTKQSNNHILAERTTKVPKEAAMGQIFTHLSKRSNRNTQKNVVGAWLETKRTRQAIGQKP
eukprot:12768585-Heterocapsa_arctica.AAC.1